MARVCDLSGKKPGVGNKVSHSLRRTRRRWLPNLVEQKFFLESEGCWVRLKVSARALKTVKKLGGLDAALRKMAKKQRGL